MQWTLDAAIAAMKADGDWDVTELGRKFLTEYETKKATETERQLQEALADIERLKAMFPILAKVA